MFPSPLHENGTEREEEKEKETQPHVLRRYFPLWVKKNPEFSFTLRQESSLPSFKKQRQSVKGSEFSMNI